jgi:monoamine oxidase
MENEVAIVGAGFAGVTAARELRRLGIPARVLESRDRIGGRTWCKRGALAGVDLEMGGTWIDPRQTHVWCEAEAYRVALGESAYGSPPTTWRIGGELRRGPLPVSADAVGDLERIAHVAYRDATRIDPRRPLAGQGVSDLDISLSEYINRIGGDAQAREATCVYLAAYGSAPPDQVSALHILRRIAAAGSLSEFVMSGASHPLVGGTTALLDAMLADAACPVTLDTPVLGVSQNAARVRLRTSAGDVESPAAILTVPVNVWESIVFDPPLSAPKQALAMEGIASRGVKVWLRVHGAPHDFSACGRGGGLEMIWNEAELEDGSSLLVGYGLDSDAIDIADREALERALRAFLPEATIIESTGHDWRNDAWARETWAVFKPGQITTHEHTLTQPEGRLIFAGSATASQWPGFIDGAIESGIRAARQTADLLT